MKTKFEEIVNVDNIGRTVPVDMNDIYRLAARENIPAASGDEYKVLLLNIDPQNGFMEGRALGVPGSIKDMERLSWFMYNNCGKITTIAVSLDTHIFQQIFFPCWWENSEGRNPDPLTIISYQDVLDGLWIPVLGEKEKTLDCMKYLDSIGKKLWIWPYHTINGTDESNIESQTSKMIYFHSAVRKSEPIIIRKGMDPYSEMFGVFKPEYNPNNEINSEFIEIIKQYNMVILAGEAGSHCLPESLIQLMEELSKDRGSVEQVIVLKDCTSPVKGCESYMESQFEMIEKKYGVQFINSTDVCFDK